MFVFHFFVSFFASYKAHNNKKILIRNNHKNISRKSEARRICKSRIQNCLFVRANIKKIKPSPASSTSLEIP